MSTTDRSLLQTILTLLDVLSSHKTEGKSWIHLLSLLCIFSILDQINTAAPVHQSASANPLQNLLSDLLKGNTNAKSADTPAPNALLSLLPLLNSPQLKSKLNSANLAAVMNVVQGLTAAVPLTNEKPAKSTESPTAPTAPLQETGNAIPSSAPSSSTASPPKDKTATNERYLDWKSSF